MQFIPPNERLGKLENLMNNKLLFKIFLNETLNQQLHKMMINEENEKDLSNLQIIIQKQKLKRNLINSILMSFK
jgi:hypothetical protein